MELSKETCNSLSELKLMKKVVGPNRIFKNTVINCRNGNRVADGNFNQGVSRAKLREYVRKEDPSYEIWESL